MKFDPAIYLPSDLADAEYAPVERPDYVSEPDEDFVGEVIDDFTDEDPENDDQDNYDEGSIDVLDVPSVYSVVEYLPRTAPDGTQVVDVVLEIQEVPRAVTYEVRLA